MSRTDPCWVKSKWCPLKYYFTSSHHDYRTHPWSHHLKYINFFKIGFQVDFQKMGEYDTVNGKLTWVLLFFRTKRCFMVCCTRSYTVHPIMSPNNPNLDSFFQDFVSFVDILWKFYNNFGQRWDMVVRKPKIIPLNTILHRFNMIVVSGVTRNTQKTPKITYFGWFSWFFVIFGS